MKNFIFFRNDRLGDFLIITNLIKALKEKSPLSNITIVSSKYNHHFISKYKIIDKVILYDKNFNILKKIKIFKKIINQQYYASFAVDGKSFSTICNIFIKSIYKFGLFYRFKLLGIPFLKPNYFLTFFFDKFEIFTSKKFLKSVEHLPSKFIRLGNYLDLKIKLNDNYYFIPTVNINKLSNKVKIILKNKFILIHLDEKWRDISSINDNFYKHLENFQKKIKKKIIITSFNNTFEYFLNLKKDLKKNNNKKIILLENSSLDIMERLVNYSSFAISCHSGFLVQIAGSNNAKIIDIINKKDYLWYSCWKPLNTKHKFIYKSFKNKQSIDVVFKNLLSTIRSF